MQFNIEFYPSILRNKCQKVYIPYIHYKKHMIENFSCDCEFCFNLDLVPGHA